MNSDGQNDSRTGHCWTFHRSNTLDRTKPWRDRIAGFKVAINNMLSMCVAGAVLARYKPQKAVEICRAVKSTAESTSDLTKEFCRMVKQELVKDVEED